MNPTPYALPLFLTSLTLTVLAAMAWRRRPAAGAAAMTVLLVAVAWWTAAYALELGSRDLDGQVFWAKTEYIGIVVVPLAWLAASWQLTARARPRLVVALALLIMPLVTLIGVWTNERHWLHWTSVEQVLAGASEVLVVSHGPLFWLHWTYLIILVLAGAALLVKPFRRGRTLQQKQILLIWLAASVPVLANLLYVSGANPFPYLDLTPFAFAITAAVGAWALLRFGLLDIWPFARDLTVASIQDAVLVANLEGVIVQANPASGMVLDVSPSMVVGKRCAEALPRSLAGLLGEGCAQPAYQVIHLDGKTAKWIEVRVSAVTDQRGEKVGTLLLMRDVSEQKLLEAQRQETENRRLAELAALFATSVAVNAHQSLADLLPAIVERAATLLGLQSGSLYLTRLDGHSLEVVIQHNLPRDWVGTVLQYGEGLSGRVAASKQSMVVSDYSAWDFRADAYREAHFKRVLAVPLLVDQRVLGVLNLMDSERAGAFDPDEIRLAELFAAQAAIAIEKTRLLEAEQGQRRTAEALRDVAMALSPEVNQERVLDLLLEQIGRVVPYEAAHIMLVTNGVARIARTRGIERFSQDAVRALENVTYRISETANLAKMMETRQPLIIPDVSLTSGWLPIEHLTHVRSWAGAPIIVRNEVVAFCSLDHGQPGFYQSEQAYPLTAFASLAAAALANVQLYGELSKAIQAREKLLRSVSHELRTPLAVILGYAELLHDQTGHANSLVDQGLSMIMAQATELKQLVDQLISFQEVDLQEMHLTAMAVGPWLERLHQSWTPLLARKGQGLTCTMAVGAHWIHGDASFLDQAMSNLVDHASKAGPDVRTVALTAASLDNQILITVTGQKASGRRDGPVPHAAPSNAIMEDREHSAGFGLSMVREIVLRHGGQLWTGSPEPDRGATVFLTLPACDPPSESLESTTTADPL